MSADSTLRVIASHGVDLLGREVEACTCAGFPFLLTDVFCRMLNGWKGKVRSKEERPLALDPVRSPKGVNREQHTHRSDSVPTGAEVMDVCCFTAACRARQPLHVICFFLGPPRFYGPYFFLSRRRKAR